MTTPLLLTVFEARVRESSRSYDEFTVTVNAVGNVSILPFLMLCNAFGIAFRP
jgi:hypothetical protein